MWYEANSGGQTHEVGTRLPNPWGFYDLHGNVLEWCEDWLDDTYYDVSPTDDPQGPASSPYDTRVLRGGSWGSVDYGRSAMRFGAAPTYRGSHVGFRVAVTVP
jgi:formylglycine-generating enzyme required for sulfatase activity